MSEMSQAPYIPLVEEISDAFVHDFFDRLRSGNLRLPPLDTSEKGRATLWSPGSGLSKKEYVLGLSCYPDGVGTITVPNEGPRAHTFYRINVRMFSEAKLKTVLGNSRFEEFRRQFLAEAAGFAQRFFESAGNRFPWIKSYQLPTGFQGEQFSRWFNFAYFRPVRLLVERIRRRKIQDSLRLGDPIFNRDSQGDHKGVVALKVRKNGQDYGLSSAHVLSYNGKAALQTDLLRPNNGRGDDRRVGVFTAAVTVPDDFKDGRVIECDAALFSPVIPFDGNVFEVGGRRRFINSVRDVSISLERLRQPVLILRSGGLINFAEVAAAKVTVPMVTHEDDVIIYSGLIEIRAPRSGNVIPKSWEHDVKTSPVVTTPGDSGSLVILLPEAKIASTSGFSAAGIIVGGNGAGGNAGLSYATLLTTVLTELSLELTPAS